MTTHFFYCLRWYHYVAHVDFNLTAILPLKYWNSSTEPPRNFHILLFFYPGCISASFLHPVVQGKGSHSIPGGEPVIQPRQPEHEFGAVSDYLC